MADDRGLCEDAAPVRLPRDRDKHLTLKAIAAVLPVSPQADALRPIAGRLHCRGAQVRRGLLRMIALNLASGGCGDDGHPRYSLHRNAKIPDEIVSANPAENTPDGKTVEGHAATGRYREPADPDSTLQDCLRGTPERMAADNAAIAIARGEHFHAALDAAQKKAVAAKSADVHRYIAREIVGLREAADMAEQRLKTARAAKAMP
jgi:hypothetical protein